MIIDVDEVPDRPAHAATLMAWLDEFAVRVPELCAVDRRSLRNALVGQLFDMVSCAPRALA